MSERAMAVADIVRQDPDVYSVGNTLGSSTLNTSNFFIALKSREAGRQASSDEIIARLRRKLASVHGVNLFMQSSQDISVGGRIARTQFQYTLTGSNIAELGEWAPRILERLRQLPQLIDVVSDHRATAFRQRQLMRPSTMRSASARLRNTLHNSILTASYLKSTRNCRKTQTCSTNST